MTKDEHQSLAVIARLAPDLLLEKEVSKQCDPLSCNRPKGHPGIHLLICHHFDKITKILRGEDV